MQVPLQITFRHMEPSNAVEAGIRERCHKLEQFAEYITSCRITVEAPHKHHHKGNLYTVKIDITLPGEQLVASRHPNQHHAHEDVYVAIRDAFDAARRQLEDYVRRRRADIKMHVAVPHGRIAELFPQDDYGMIVSVDGREIYFHRNSLLNADFDELQAGTRVCFVEERGDKGPQASSVRVEGKHHAV